MPAGTVFTIISALIAAGTTIGTGVANKQATDKANKHSLKLYEQEREDQLKRDKISNSINKYRMETERMGIKQRRREFAKEFGFAKEKEAYGRAKQSSVDLLNLLNQDRSLQSNFLSFFQRR